MCTNSKASKGLFIYKHRRNEISKTNDLFTSIPAVAPCSRHRQCVAHQLACTCDNSTQAAALSRIWLHPRHGDFASKHPSLIVTKSKTSKYLSLHFLPSQPTRSPSSPPPTPPRPHGPPVSSVTARAHVCGRPGRIAGQHRVAAVRTGRVAQRARGRRVLGGGWLAHAVPPPPPRAKLMTLRRFVCF